MSPLLARASRQYLTRHPWQLALGILGITLGVAVVVAVDLAKSSALSAFDQATRTITGNATHRIIGGPGGIDESIYRDLRLRWGLRPAAPRIETAVLMEGRHKEPLRLIGVDQFAEIEIQSDWITGISQSHQRGNGVLVELLTEPGAVILETSTAERIGLRSGDQATILVGTGRKKVRLTNVFSADRLSGKQTLQDIVLTDIATAQELTGMLGRLSYIDIIVDDPADKTLIKPLKKQLPAGVELITTGAGTQSIREMTRAFYTNISVLSLLSLIVGMFLIYNTMSFLVVQRRPLIGGLRALGVTRTEIFRLVLFEAGAIGLCASVLGLAVGVVLGNAVLALIEKTLNSVYFSVSSPTLLISPWILGKGLLLGLGVTFISILRPAFEAIRVPPIHVLSRSSLESNTLRLLLLTGLQGIVAIILGVLTITLWENSLFTGFAGMAAIMFGCAFITPAIAVVIMRCLQRILGSLFGIMGKLPARFIAASLSRTGVAMAALMVAVATTIGLELMITSFRHSVAQWLDNRLNADFYVTPVVSGSSNTSLGLNADLAEQIAALQGIKAIGTMRRLRIRNDNGSIRLNALDLPAVAAQGFRFKQGTPDKVWPQFYDKDAVIVSEAFAYHHQLEIGSDLSLKTDHGIKPFSVSGVYVDYNAGQGIVSMSRNTFNRHWNDREFSGISVYPNGSIDPSQLRADIAGLMTSEQFFQITDNRKIVEISLAIFDQAFIITDVLRWLASLIAFIGIISALMALQLDRAREFGTLRALGVTPRQLWRLITGETVLMGCVSGLLALPVGALMTALLILVVNQRSFGWSMEILIDPFVFSKGLLLAVSAAVLAGLYPAYQMSKTLPAEALRAE